MRKAAVLSDIHSNYEALRCCIADARQNGAEIFFFLGDYVSDLADPQRTLDFIAELQAEASCYLVRGNRDRYMLDCQAGLEHFAPGAHSGSLFYTYRNLRSKDFAFLAGLPSYRTVETAGQRLELAHATAESDHWYFDETDDRMESVFSAMKSACFLTGHSHRQYLCRKNGSVILNPGSVGVPLGSGNLTQYALLELDGDQMYGELRQIPYDLRWVIRRQFDSGLADCGKYWSFAVLYTLLTGENWTNRLLKRALALAEEDVGRLQEDSLWKKACEALQIPTQQKQFLSLCKN